MKCCDADPILPRGTRTFSRRELLSLAARTAGAAAVAPSLLDLLCRHSLAQTSAKSGGKKRLVLLWLEGGPSQIDMFDPKPGAPTNGPFKALTTDVKGWLMGEHLPGLAKRAEQLAVIRTMTSKEGSHARARELLHTGYTPNPSVAFPGLGAIVAHELGDLDGDLPAFVQIDGPPGSSGYLGTESAPFVINNVNGKIKNVSYRRGVTPERMDRREELCRVLDDGFAGAGGVDDVTTNRAQRRRARRLMDTKLLTAFELDHENDAVRDAYGRSNFGQGVLLARRLLESGVAAIEVVIEGWDTHSNNFNITSDLCAQLDPAFSALIDDLKTRGMFDDTLIVCMGEFGRTPAINPSDGRDHWPNNYCVALAGGGIKGGTVIGETDERGENIVSEPVQVADLFATIAQTLRFDRDKEFQATTRRPAKLVDSNGTIVRRLLS